MRYSHPFVKHSSIRILLALIAQYELKLDQLDGNLEEEITCLNRRIQNFRKEKYGIQTEEITMWIKTISKTVVQAFRQFYKRQEVQRSHYDLCELNYLMESTSIYYCKWMICSSLLKADAQLINWRMTCLSNLRWKILWRKEGARHEDWETL